MKISNKLKKVAEEFATLENKLAKNEDSEQCFKQMGELAKGLSLSDMMMIDEYLQAKIQK